MDYYTHIDEVRKQRNLDPSFCFRPLWYAGRKFAGVPVEFKADLENRIIEGHAAAFGNRDFVGDVIVKGAFSKTLQEQPAGIPLLRDHDPRRAIGKSMEIGEDEFGLFTRNKVSKTQDGDEALELANDGVLTGMSIGFRPIKKDFGRAEGKASRFLREIKLVENSLVLFPANTKARVLAVKSAESQMQFVLQIPDLLETFADLGAMGREEKQACADAIERLTAFTNHLRKAAVDENEIKGVSELFDVLFELPGAIQQVQKPEELKQRAEAIISNAVVEFQKAAAELRALQDATGSSDGDQPDEDGVLDDEPPLELASLRQLNADMKAFVEQSKQE